MGLAVPMSIEHLKQQRKTLLADVKRVWDTYMGNFPILPLHRDDARYVVSTDAIVNDDGSGSGSCIQEFYPGQEIDLLDYVDYVSKEFRTSHIIVFIRDLTGYIERYVTIGN
jgi:hypothetical protein